MTKERWGDYQRLTALWPEELRTGRIQTEEEVIKKNADWLLGRLYKPSTDVGARAGGDEFDASGVEHDPINWGDLGVVEVEQFADGTWRMVIEESGPECSALPVYVSTWLARWVLTVEFTTEW